MFDPTIFENLKIAFENQCYDLDNLDGEIVIIDRKDILDMAIMSRKWSLSFTLAQWIEVESSASAELILSSSVEDIADEILERATERTGCTLTICFHCIVTEPLVQCPAIERAIMEIWEREIHVKQELSTTFDQTFQLVDQGSAWMPNSYHNRILLTFDRRINEDQMEDIEELIHYTMVTLEAVGRAVL